MNIISDFTGEYYWLSNFYEHKFADVFGTYTTVEHYFQAHKTTDHDEFKLILNADTPALAKKFGRRCSLKSDWEFIKDDIMRLGLQYKFADPQLRQKLLDTGNAYLLEGTTWGDSYWGYDIKKGVGKNMLGELLMERRRNIQDEL